MPRPAAEDRLRRILAVVPWVVAHDGPRLDEVCARFGYRSQSELQGDLDLLFMCGVPPYTPDTLIEVDVAGGRVWIRYADWFERPLRLTPAEALSLVAASSALLAAGDPRPIGPAPGEPDGGDPETPLARGLAKLAAALGVSEALVEVELGPAPAGRLEQLQAATAAHHPVEVDYYAYGRDRWSTRVIEPHLVYSASGQWYVSAFCRSAQADRLFRVDRIRRAATLGETFAPRPAAAPPPVFDVSEAGATIELDLSPAAAWAATQYPTVSRHEIGDGHVRVVLPVGGEAWLARLLLRLGPDATVVAGDAAPAKEAARQVLRRYRAPGGNGRPSAPSTLD